jgi:outer membrane protein assembly factor BamB
MIKCMRILFIFVFACTVLTMHASADDWPLFQKDITNSGVTSDPAPTGSPGDWVIWEQATSTVANSGGVDVAPIVVGDTVFTVAIDGTVRAINKTTGEVKWTSATIKDSIPPLGTPAYGNGKLFVVPNKKSIYAFDASTGEELWNATVETDIVIGEKYFNQLITPVTYHDGKVYFGEWMGSQSFTQKYYCYNEDGTLRWMRNSTSNRGYYWCGAAIIKDYLVFADGNGTLTSVDKDTGETIDEFAAHDFFGFESSIRRIRSSINYQADTGRIYASSEAGYCFMVGINEDDGTFDFQDTAAKHIGRSTSTPAVYNGRVYVGTGSVLEAPGLKKLYCLDADSLTEIWNFTASGPIQASPVISTAYDDGDGEVYIYFTGNTQEGKVFCLRDYTGNTDAILQWTYEPPEGIKQFTLQGVAISDGWLYFANDAGYIFGIKEWNQWNDPDSDEGAMIALEELQEVVHLWVKDLPSSTTGEKITLTRLQKIVHDWLNP